MKLKHLFLVAAIASVGVSEATLKQRVFEGAMRDRGVSSPNPAHTVHANEILQAQLRDRGVMDLIAKIQIAQQDPYFKPEVDVMALIRENRISEFPQTVEEASALAVTLPKVAQVFVEHYGEVLDKLPPNRILKFQIGNFPMFS